MIPVRNDKHVTEAKAKFTSMFRDRRVISALIQSFVKPLQTLENVLWDVINKRNLENATGKLLDILGALVGQPRDGRSDDEYREAIRLRILILRSTGRIPDLLKIIETAAPGSAYRDTPPACFEVVTSSTGPAYKALVDAMRDAKPLGVGANMLYTADPSFAELLIPSDAGGATVSTARGPSHTDGTPRAVPVHVTRL